MQLPNVEYSCHLCGASVKFDAGSIQIGENARVRLRRMMATAQCIDCELAIYDEIAAKVFSTDQIH